MTPKSATNVFDPKDFLAKVGVGKTIIEFHRNQKVFSQGDVADTVFYIQSGQVKLTVMSEQGKEAVVAILEPGQFFGESRDDHRSSRRAEVFRTVYDVSPDQEQPD
jgi:CRP-like cAMP-binding protein